VLASSKSGTDIGSLLYGYQLCAATKGKSPNSLAIVTRSVTYLYDFLSSNDLSTDVTQIGVGGMRAFILYLHQKRCFSNHPYSKAQLRGLSRHTINTYMRSIRTFWSWLAEEEIIESNLFSKLKIPKPPKKIITTFSQHQIDLLLRLWVIRLRVIGVWSLFLPPQVEASCHRKICVPCIFPA